MRIKNDTKITLLSSCIIFYSTPRKLRISGHFLSEKIDVCIYFRESAFERLQVSKFICGVLLCCSRKKSLWDLFITVIRLGLLSLSLSLNTLSPLRCVSAHLVSLSPTVKRFMLSLSLFLSFSLSFHRRGKQLSLVPFSKFQERNKGSSALISCQIGFELVLAGSAQFAI